MIVKSLGYKIKRDNPMIVRVANGEKLESKVMFQPICGQMQNYEFQFQLRTLNLGGSDMVLGINWLSQFGPITCDFAEGHMSFKYKGETVAALQ